MRRDPDMPLFISCGAGLGKHPREERPYRGQGDDSLDAASGNPDPGARHRVWTNIVPDVSIRRPCNTQQTQWGDSDDEKLFERAPEGLRPPHEAGDDGAASP
jgi:hypothetical protein